MDLIEPTTQETLAFLSDPKTYPDAAGGVLVIETPVSWVFLTDNHAYKLKKAVHFAWLDDRSRAKRQTDCMLEVSRNRRFCEDVYLGVKAIVRGSDGRLTMKPLAAQDHPIDTVVAMKRLPADRILSHRLHEDRLTDDDVEHIAHDLVQRSLHMKRDRIGCEDYVQHLERQIRIHCEELLSIYGSQQELKEKIHFIRQAQLAFLHGHRGQVTQRVSDGKIVEGHGDLRPEHVAIDKTVQIFDCAEGNSPLGTVDQLEELAFFALECQEKHQRLSQRILQHYRDRSADSFDNSLLAFYQSYRSFLKAGCDASRGCADPEIESATPGYLEQAHTLAARFYQPYMILIAGPAGSGKSCIAKYLSAVLGIDIYSTDQLSSEVTCKEAYTRVFEESARALQRQEAILLDGRFDSDSLRSQVGQLANDRKIPLLSIWCQCPINVSACRIKQRASEGQGKRPNKTDRPSPIHCTQEPTSTTFPHQVIDAGQPLEKVLHEAWEKVETFLRTGGPIQGTAGDP